MSKQAGRYSEESKSFLAPLTPTIGTATDVGTGLAYNNGSATVTFTPNSAGAAATSDGVCWRAGRRRAARG